MSWPDKRILLTFRQLGGFTQMQPDVTWPELDNGEQIPKSPLENARTEPNKGWWRHNYVRLCQISSTPQSQDSPLVYSSVLHSNVNEFHTRPFSCHWKQFWVHIQLMHLCNSRAVLSLFCNFYLICGMCPMLGWGPVRVVCTNNLNIVWKIVCAS